MNPPARLSACLVTVTALAAAAGLLYLGRSTQPTNGGPMSLQDGQRLSRELDGRMASVRQSSGAKEAITADVIAGRRTLLEAAAAFQALDAQHPGFHWEMFRQTYQGSSDGERSCRAVLRWVWRRLPEGSSQAEVVLFRLEAELQAHLLEHGTVVLPPP